MGRLILLFMLACLCHTCHCQPTTLHRLQVIIDCDVCCCSLVRQSAERPCCPAAPQRGNRQGAKNAACAPLFLSVTSPPAARGCARAQTPQAKL